MQYYGTIATVVLFDQVSKGCNPPQVALQSLILYKKYEISLDKFSKTSKPHRSSIM